MRTTTSRTMRTTTKKMRMTTSTTTNCSTTKTNSTTKRMREGEQRLYDLLASYDSVIVAFSGGVDSAYLAWVATQVLGPAALCITADSPSYPDHHRQLALRIAREFGLHHEIIHTAELERAEYRANPVNRCYYCKHELYTSLSTLARARGFDVIVD